MEANDAELLRDSRSGDRDAFAQLVDRHKDRVVSYLTRLTGCPDRAEDLAQDTFIRLYQNLGRYREQGVLAAYLLRIATNLVRSEQRRRKRWKLLRPVLLASGFRHARLDDDGPDPDAGPQDTVLASEEQHQVSRALATLDLRFRAPLVMREIEGLSYGEIAEALEVSEGTVKSRLHRARSLLKEKLTPYWNGGQCLERRPAT